MKELIEKRNALVAKMKELAKTVETEKRAFTDEENTSFDSIKREIEQINATIEALRAADAHEFEGAKVDNGEPQKMTEEERELKTFANFIRGQVDPSYAVRAGEDTNMTKSANSGVIPTSVAAKIIDYLNEVCPLFRDAAQYNVKGKLEVPFVDNSNTNLAVAYSNEFSELVGTAVDLNTVELSGYLAGVLTKISKSLINNTDLDIVSFVVKKVGDAIARFYEHEALVGTSEKCTGLSTASNGVTASSQTAVTSDELIGCQDSIVSAYQNGAYWVMAPATLTAIRKLKNSQNEYLLNPDIREGFGYSLLGKPVYVSDQCPAMTAGNKAIYYVNPSEALAAKIVEDGNEIEILKEKFATQHALGIVAWAEIDCKIQNQQAVACITMASSSSTT